MHLGPTIVENKEPGKTATMSKLLLQIRYRIRIGYVADDKIISLHIRQLWALPATYAVHIYAKSGIYIQNILQVSMEE